MLGKEHKIRKSTFGLVAVLMAGVVAVPAVAAILVQNYTQWTVEIQDPVIQKLEGADADYDSDADPDTGYVGVDTGTTFSNNDSGDSTPGTNDVLLSREEIRFTCFTGHRTYYDDLIQIANTDSTNAWDVTLTVEVDGAGNPATSHTFTDVSGDEGNADIWMFGSSVDSTTPVTTEAPNPANYGSFTNWVNSSLIQLEYVDSTAGAGSGASDLSIASGGGVLDLGSIPASEQRQLGLVVDCDSNMADESSSARSGIFRVTVAATPS